MLTTFKLSGASSARSRGYSRSTAALAARKSNRQGSRWMVAAYCVRCQTVFQARARRQEPKGGRSIQLRPGKCPTCQARTHVIRADDMPQSVIALIEQGPRMALAVLEAYAAYFEETGQLPQLISSAPVEVGHTHSDLAKIKKALLPLVFLALLQFLSNSSAKFETKVDVNELIEQIFGADRRLPDNLKPPTQHGGADHKDRDSDGAGDDPGPKPTPI